MAGNRNHRNRADLLKTVEAVEGPPSRGLTRPKRDALGSRKPPSTRGWGWQGAPSVIGAPALPALAPCTSSADFQLLVGPSTPLSQQRVEESSRHALPSDAGGVRETVGYRTRLAGMSTELITWITPLAADTSAVTTRASSTWTISPCTEIRSELPSRDSA